MCYGIGNGGPLQYSCLENPLDTGIWWSTVLGVTKSQTQLSVPLHTCVNMKKSPKEKRCKLDENMLSCMLVYVCVISLDFIF